MNPIIEKVARAMRQTKVRPDQMYEDVARAAIRATLEGLRDNVSEGMAWAAHDASDFGPAHMVKAAISEAIAELDT